MSYNPLRAPYLSIADAGEVGIILGKTSGKFYIKPGDYKFSFNTAALSADREWVIPNLAGTPLIYTGSAATDKVPKFNGSAWALVDASSLGGGGGIDEDQPIFQDVTVTGHAAIARAYHFTKEDATPLYKINVNVTGGGDASIEFINDVRDETDFDVGTDGTFNFYRDITWFGGTANTVLTLDGDKLFACSSVTPAELQILHEIEALSIVGNSTNDPAAPFAIGAGANYQVFRRAGTALGFGAIDLSQSAAVTGILAAGNLPTAAADGTTKGAATFAAADFNATSGLISIDYANGQAATGSVKGFLTAADWTTFNSKQASLTTGTLTATSPVAVSGARSVIGGAADITIADAAADGSTKGAATFAAADFNSSSGLISIDYTNGQAATGSVKGFLIAADWTTFNNKVATSRTISTTSPLSGGGDLSADRTIAIANAAADGTTKGAAAFTAADFDASSGVISIDYTNGQAASASTKGFLTSTDWSTFNSKQAALTTGTLSATSPVSVSGARTVIGGAADISIANAAADGSTKGAAAFTAADFDAASGVISIDYTNGQKATTSIPGFLTAADWTTFNNKVATSRSISTTAPLTGGGDLSANRTFAITQSATGADGYLSSTDWNTFNNKVATSRSISTTSPLSGGGDLSANRTIAIANAAADGSTKGAAAFNATNFTASSGVINTAQNINTGGSPTFAGLTLNGAMNYNVEPTTPSTEVLTALVPFYIGEIAYYLPLYAKA